MNRMDLYITDHPSTHRRDDSEDFICDAYDGSGCGLLFGLDENDETYDACPECENEDISCAKPWLYE